MRQKKYSHESFDLNNPVLVCNARYVFLLDKFETILKAQEKGLFIITELQENELKLLAQKTTFFATSTITDETYEARAERLLSFLEQKKV